MYAIYGLRDPRDNSVFYVGYTQDVYRRFLDHIQCSGNNFAKNVRVLELRKANQMVIMETFEQVETRDLAEAREGYWIRHFLRLGVPLTNVNKSSSEQNRSPEFLPAAHVALPVELSYEQVQAEWNAGHRSARKLAKALTNRGYDMKKDRAWMLIREMKAISLL